MGYWRRLEDRLLWAAVALVVALLIDRYKGNMSALQMPAASKLPTANKSPRTSAPKQSSSSESAETDDFTRIEGIGPKVRDALVDAGVTTFRQLAGLSTDDIQRIVREEHGVRMIGNGNTWAKQAQYVLDGDLDGLKAYQDRLIGGREPETE